MKYLIIMMIAFVLVSCNIMTQDRGMYSRSMNLVESTPIINDFGRTIFERFDPPKGYDRIMVDNDDFGGYLRNLSLKPEGAPAKLFDGSTKPNNNIYVSVVDLPISRKDLQSSADAIIRLKAEYLYSKEKFDQIYFHDDSEKIDFLSFSNGDTKRSSFDLYLDYVMEKVTTPNFCKDLKNVTIKDIQVGDVFVQNTMPNGHAVIVVDMVKNKKGEKLFLLAQSFQPAQEIQIVSNPSRDDISPWYKAEQGEILTPEWRFLSSDLMRFKDLNY